MSDNEYYFIPSGLLKAPILDHVVSDVDNSLYSDNGNEVMVKTYDGIKAHTALSAHQKRSYKEALKELENPKWNKE